MPAKLSPQEFVAKWRDVTLKERAAAQEHFIDLCRLIGHPTPAEFDPSGQKFTFEAGTKIKDEDARMKAEKKESSSSPSTSHSEDSSSFILHPSSFRAGWADVWKKGFFAWEYKGKHANLDKAYQQLQQYREALHNPPLLVVSDLDSIVIHTNFTNSVKRVERLGLDDLLTPAGLNTLRAVFENPDFFRTAPSAAQVTQAAAKEFARLAELLRKYGEDPHQIAHFLIRLLFCLFAEDIGLLPERLFNRLVSQTRRTPGAFTAQLRQLFGAMATGGWFGVDKIAHFDGGLFDDDAVLALDSEGMDILARVAALDWGSIEPSILGTLFERSLDPAKRAQLGAHYTSTEDILLIVEPVLMAPLRRRWQEVQAEAQAKAKARDAAKEQARRRQLNHDLSNLLLNFAAELGLVRVLDPACGSGNFLCVALKQLLNLWKEVSVLAGQLGLTLFMPHLGPSPIQLYGIEVNPYAHELAQTTVWIGYIQWLRDNGFGEPDEPILKPLKNIVRMDAILAYEPGVTHLKPVEPEWPEAEVIIGNPPFLGSRKMRPVLGNEYCDMLLKVYDGQIEGLPDLICYWFEKAQTLIAKHKVRRVGLLATRAIRGGTNKQVLDHIKATGNIFMAWSDREWILDGAMVHVSMVGFDDGTEKEIFLNGNQVSSINSDLTANIDLSVVSPLEENANLSFQGVVLRGPFNISFEQAQEMLTAIGNPNRRPNSDVLKPRRTGQDIVSRASNEFVIDFGIDTPIEKAAQYVAPFEYLKEHVYPMRQQAQQATAREKWWIHWNPRAQMRNALEKLPRYIATPRVAKHRLFVWLDSSIQPDAQLVVFARSDDYFFGVLHSKTHELWSRRQGTQLRDAESGFRYTSTTTFETFPFPWPPGQEPKDDPHIEAIAQTARKLVELRDNWLNPPGMSEAKLKKRTLTSLYNQRPTWLELAHHKLDRAVFAAYGWYDDLSDEDILARLLALNLERAGRPATELR